MEQYLCHYGILGMHWGIRRYQNPDGSLTEAGKKRLQTKEFNIIKKSQKKSYRNDYDRMLDYQKNSSLVRERSKELKDLSEKAKDLDFKLEEYTYYNEKVMDLARKNAIERAKKEDPYFNTEGEKYQSNSIEYYMYDKGEINKASKEIFNNDNEYKELKKEYKQSIKDYKEKCKQITNEIIGEYGKEKIIGSGTNMNYEELVYYALSKPNTMWMFTYEEDIGRK